MGEKIQRKPRKTKHPLKGKHLEIALDDYYEKADCFMAEICRRLQEARLASDVSVAGLSIGTGLTEAAIYKYERTGRISMETFIRVMIALQIEIDMLPVFDEGLDLGKEFKNIVRGLSPEMQTKILNEVRSIASLVK